MWIIIGFICLYTELLSCNMICLFIIAICSAHRFQIRFILVELLGVMSLIFWLFNELLKHSNLCVVFCLLWSSFFNLKKQTEKSYISKFTFSLSDLSIFPTTLAQWFIKTVMLLYKASLIHMFWMCPSLEKYWMDVFQTLSLILNVDLEPNASFLARCIVLLRWRDAAPAHPHSVAEGHYVLSKSLKKKNLLFSNSWTKFQKVLGPFLKYFQNLQSN